MSNFYVRENSFFQEKPLNNLLIIISMVLHKLVIYNDIYVKNLSSIVIMLTIIIMKVYIKIIISLHSLDGYNNNDDARQRHNQ